MALILGAVALGGCSEPYLFTPQEFDRSSSTFRQEPTDRTEVTVCYNGQSATDHDVAELAAAECGRFGKVARLREEGFGDCPLLIPVVARFDCLAP
jgi:hypothetical protein